MLAFELFVYRLPEVNAAEKADMDGRLLGGDYHDLLVRWTVFARPGCLGWIEDLVDRGEVRKLDDSGFPMLYVGDREAILSALDTQRDITPELAEKLDACRDDDELVVTAWDLS